MPSDASRLKQVQFLAKVLDEAFVIPGTNQRIGLDSLIGLIPVGGDLLGVALSSLIVYHANKLGVPKSIQSKMWQNIVVDALVGLVPVLGDVVDVTWKANKKNALLLEEHLRREQRV